MEKTIKLFKALEVENKKLSRPSKTFLEETLKYGVVFSPNVIANYNEPELISIAREIGVTSRELNNSFHKSWEKVKNTPMSQLFMEQVIHYFTTYGLELFGAYSKDTIFIPAEELNVIKNEIELIFIKGLTRKEIKERLLTLLETGVALSQETVDDCVSLSIELKIDSLDRINNKEVRVALGLKLGLVPSDPTEFLRLLIYKATKKTLLIKDGGTISAIKESKDDDCIKLLQLYDDKYGLDKLSEIFYRFKPLFLAFKYSKTGKTLVNRMRKYAIDNHKPMKEDYLNSITHLNKVDKTKLSEELEKANIFRKIRLAYALKFRLKEDNHSIMYRVRNGKAYSKEFNYDKKAYVQIIYNLVVDSIVKDIKQNVKGKKIHIPDYITYSLPSSEKMFSGETIPSGTYITVDKDMLVGVHWNDIKHNRIDLDLSMINVDGKIGWDSRYRDDNGSVLFSGDMTAAPSPNGATELLYVKRQGKVDYILNLNYFNYNEAVEVPFQIVVAKETVKDFHSNYTINPNNILCMLNTKINKKQKILGLLVATTNECKFYFCDTYIGDKISAGGHDYIIHSKNYLYSYYQNTINLNDVLVKAGAKLVEKDKCEIDLTPSALQKDTIINLIANKK
jgi:hypothetical protein